MTETVHLVVEQGPDHGKTVRVPPRGARVGRSARNDIVLTDPLLSRYHCRIFFKAGEGLWVADLGSANETLVNGAAVQEARLRAGDTVALGDTVLRVLSDEAAPAPGPQPGAAPPVIDLGLAAPRISGREARPRRGLLVVGLCAVVALAAAVWMPKWLRGRTTLRFRPPPVATQTGRTIEVEYEKVEATSDNIFRYSLGIDANRTLSVAIDDLKNDRHVRKEKPVSAEYLDDLARWVLDSGFFALSEEYMGIQPDVLDTWTLSVTVDRRTHRTKVVNRMEPEVFRLVREKFEECGKNELGLWAIQFSPEKLVEMAQEAYLLGRRLHDERDVRAGNLAAAILKFKEAEWYLETVEPKPDFYGEMLSQLADFGQELQQRHDDHNFRAIRAITLREWEEAAKELRTICELIPDRADTRHDEARKRLLDIESRLNTKQR